MVFFKVSCLSLTAEYSEMPKKFILQVNMNIQPSSSGLESLSSASEETDSTTDEEFAPVLETTSHKKSGNSDFVLYLNRDEWIKQLIPHADRGKLSSADIFYFCAATIQSGGGNLDDIQLSTATFRRLRLKAENKTGNAIKDQFIFPEKLMATNTRIVTDGW